MSKLRYLAILVTLALTTLAACEEEGVAPLPTATAQPVATPTATPSPTPTSTPTPTPSPTPTPIPSPTPILSPTSTSTSAAVVPSDPQALEILEQSVAAMLEVGSLAFQLDATIGLPEGSPIASIPVIVFGQYVAPDRAYGKIVVDLGFFGLEVETIVVGDSIYVMNPETGGWKLSDNPSEVMLNPLELARVGNMSLGQLVFIGEETLDDVEVYHLRGAPPRSLLGGAEGEFEADVWIGVDDLLMRKILATGQLPLEDVVTGGLPVLGGGTATLTMAMDISGYDEPIEIEPPELD